MIAISGYNKLNVKICKSDGLKMFHQILICMILYSNKITVLHVHVYIHDYVYTSDTNILINTVIFGKKNPRNFRTIGLELEIFRTIHLQFLKPENVLVNIFYSFYKNYYM